MVSLWGGDLGPWYHHFFGLASAETLQFPSGLQLSIKAAPGLYLISTEGLWVQLSQLRPSSTEGQGGNSGAPAPRWTMVRPGGCVGPHVPQITAQAATSLLIGFFPRMLLRAGGSRHLCSQISPVEQEALSPPDEWQVENTPPSPTNPQHTPILGFLFLFLHPSSKFWEARASLEVRCLPLTHQVSVQNYCLCLRYPRG